MTTGPIPLAELTRDGEPEIQWNRITERGSVLSRYISPGNDGCTLNWALGHTQGARNWTVTRPELDKDTHNSTDTLSELDEESPIDALERIFATKSKESRILFCENMTKPQLKRIGRTCGLDIGDWARATRWVNLPEMANYRNKHVWMFFEVPTIWKEKISEPTHPPPDLSKSNIIPFLLKRSSSTGLGKVSMNRTLPNWRPRRVGVFVSRNPCTDAGSDAGTGATDHDDTPWTCLVLVERLEKTENEYVFCYRKVARETAFPHPNARCISGPRHYTIEESDLQGVITYLVHDLLEYHMKGTEKSKRTREERGEDLAKRCAKIVTELGKDIFWGWAEFTTQVVQFSAVYDPRDWIKSLKKWDPCWRLFTYNAILNESRFLSRAVKGIVAAVRSAHHQGTEAPTPSDDLVAAVRSLVNALAPSDPGDFRELLGCLTQLESDAAKATDFVNGTIAMVQNHRSNKETRYATHTNANMEYLAILAAIFLPLSLFTGAFGMNIVQLGAGSSPEAPPEWWVVFLVSVGGSIGFVLLIIVGKIFWGHYRPRKLERRFLNEMTSNEMTVNMV